MRKYLPACLLLMAVFAGNVAGQPPQERMDYGPFLNATYVCPTPADNVAYRGIAVPFTAKLPGEHPDGPIGTGKFAKKGPKNVVGKAPAQVYSTHRSGFGGYQLNVPPGTYKLTLHFCETTENAAGKRVFDVALQGKVVAQGLDIFDRVGQNAALDLSFDGVEVNDGQQLVIHLNKLAGEPLLCGLAVDNKEFGRKINCGGPAVNDYVADWSADYNAAAQVGKAGVIFDTEMLRYAAVWTGGFLKLQGVVFNGDHGPNPGPTGNILFATKPLPGWANDGNLDDPREKNKDPREMKAGPPYGPLPRQWARFKGMYRHDDGVVFKYTVGASEVLDMPSFEVQDGLRFFCRTLNMTPSDQPRSVVVADLNVDGPPNFQNNEITIRSRQGHTTWISFQGGPARTLFATSVSRAVLQIPPSKEPVRIKIVHWVGNASKLTLPKAFAKLAPPADLSALTKGSKSFFPQTVTTKGTRGESGTNAYAVDTINVPFTNPYNSWMRFGGVDFFQDGRAAITTWSGDVWIVSGLDDKLEKVTWKRFASGLFQPLGIKIVDNVTHVLCRDGVYRLHDLNGDGEADYFEVFNNDFLVTKNFHEFIYDLHTDAQGNFYFIKGGPVRPGGDGWDAITPSHGSLFKLSRDGQKLEIIARGFRAPNGMSVGPRGEITTGDNEGTWTPTTPLNWIKPGGFYGVPEFSLRSPAPTVRDNPLCWLPKENPPYGQFDNSSGGQVWITGNNFGPLSNQLLHLSYGTCTLFNVLKEEVNGQIQGGVVPIMLKFDSGITRARFVDKDNALYLVGLRGWQTTATKDAGFYRVRYAGNPAYLPIDLNVTPEAVKITFSDPLDAKAATTAGNYSVQRWNYRWTQNYGSPHFSVENPRKEGRDDMTLQSVTLSPDGKTVTLKLADIKPVMQMRIVYQLKNAFGAPVRNQILHTVNAVGDMRGEVHVGEYRVVKMK